MSLKLNIIGIKGEKKAISVSDSLEEFNNTTVNELKTKIKRSLRTRRSRKLIRLLFADKQLKDEETLESYEIKPGSTIFIVIRLPGGGGPLPPEYDDSDYDDEELSRTDSMEKLTLNM